MKELIGREKLIELVPSGSSVMIGGFLTCGAPIKLIDIIAESENKDYTIIVNDTSWPDFGIGKWVARKQVKKVYVSHIGHNPETRKLMDSGEMDVALTPQGTLAEQIRAAGAGLGGVLTPTGIGTAVENGKQVIEVDGKKYLLETALKADVALIKAHIADRFGNLVYRKTARNFNPVMAMGAETVIVQADKIVETGSIDPDQVMTPGIFVNYIYQEEN